MDTYGHTVYALVAVVLIVGSSIAAGDFLWGRCRAVSNSADPLWPADRLLLCGAIGCNAIAAFVLFLNYLHLGSEILYVAALLGLSLIGYSQIWQYAGRTSLIIRSVYPSLQAYLPITLLGAATLGAALTLPEGWDELVYHIELPRRWLNDHSMPVYWDLPYSGLPSLAECIFLLCAPINEDLAPKLICWTAWTVGLCLLFGGMRTFISNRAAQLLTIAFAVSDTVLLVSGNCYVEAIALMNVAAILRLLQFATNNRSLLARANVIGLAILVAGTLCVKPTNAPLFALPIALALLESRNRTYPLSGLLRAAATYLAVVVAFCFLFYLRPALYTGNPFFPYFDETFTQNLARIQSSQFHQSIGSSFGVTGVIPRLLSPVLLAFNQSIFDGSFGLQFLAILPLAALGGLRARQSESKSALPFACVVSFVLSFAFWAMTAQQARFAVPGSLCVYFAAAYGLKTLPTHLYRIIMGGILGLALFSAPWGTAGFYSTGWLIQLGVLSKTSSLDEATAWDYLPMVKAIEKNTPVDAKILFLFEHRTFYIPRRCVIGTPFFQSLIFTPPEHYSTADALLKTLTDNQITHVVIAVNQPGPDFSTAWSNRLGSFLDGLSAAIHAGGLRIIGEQGPYKILELRNIGN